VVVSSPGAVFKNSLKEPPSKLELPPSQTVRIGQKLSDAAISGSKKIWAQCQRDIREVPGILSEGITSNESISEEDEADVDLDCTENEHTSGKSGVIQVAKGDAALPLSDEDECVFIEQFPIGVCTISSDSLPHSASNP
jgi:hypothetical protein